MTTAASNFDALLDDDEDGLVDATPTSSDDSVADGPPEHVAHDGTITVALTDGTTVQFPVEGTSARPNRGGYNVETEDAYYAWPWTSIVGITTTKDSPAVAEAIKAAKEAARAYYGESATVVTDGYDSGW